MEAKIKQAEMILSVIPKNKKVYLAFSGGKDSQCIYHLAQDAEINFEAHFSNTTNEYPETIKFIKQNYKDVIIDLPNTTFFREIAKRGVPTRIYRHCCSTLKEGKNTFVDGSHADMIILGVRKEESQKRKLRESIEIHGVERDNLAYDNMDGNFQERAISFCERVGKKYINPIINWTTEDVFNYLRLKKIKWCSLYDEGHKRIGCMLCPMSKKSRIAALKKYPKLKERVMEAIDIFLDRDYKRNMGYKNRRERYKVMNPNFTTAEKIFDWWITEKMEGKNERS